jgi:hypothetical protein
MQSGPAADEFLIAGRQLSLPVKVSRTNVSGSSAPSKKPKRQTSRATKSVKAPAGSSRKKATLLRDDEEPIGLYQDDDFPMHMLDDDIVDVTDAPKNAQWPPLRSSKKLFSTVPDEDIVEISDDDQTDNCTTLDAKLKKIRNIVGHSPTLPQL